MPTNEKESCQQSYQTIVFQLVSRSHFFKSFMGSKTCTKIYDLKNLEEKRYVLSDSNHTEH